MRRVLHYDLSFTGGPPNAGTIAYCANQESNGSQTDWFGGEIFFDLFIRPESDQCLFCLHLSATNKLAKGRHTNSSLRTLS